jgi:hypothetical protein
MEIGPESDEPIQAPIPGEVPVKRELPTPIQEPVAPVEEPVHARHLYFQVSEGKIEILELADNG